MKKLVFILMSLCLWTVARSQGVKILAPISTNDPTDTYPTHVDSLGMGGYMSVSSITSRNNIPEARRKAGMLVYVKGIDSTYQLQDDLTTWTSFKLGGTTDTTNLSFRIDTVASHIGEVGTDTTFGANAPVTISRSGNKVTYGVDTANAAHGLATKDNLNAVKDSIDAIKEHPLSVIQPLYIKGDTAIAIDTSRAAHNAATQYYADSLSRKVVHDSLSTVSGVNLGNSNLINIPAYGTRIFNTNGGELHFVNNSGSYRFVIDNDGVYFKGNVFTPFNNDDPGNKFLTTGVDGAMELQSLPIDTAFATDNTLRIYRSGNLITYKADTSKIATIKAVMDSISNHSGGSGTDTITEVHAPLLKSISGNKQIITADTSAGSTHIATQNFVTQAIADIPSGSDSAIAVDETMTKSVSGNIITLGVNGDIIVDTSTISDDSAHLDNTNIYNSSGRLVDSGTYRAINLVGGTFAGIDTLLNIAGDQTVWSFNPYQSFITAHDDEGGTTTSSGLNAYVSGGSPNLTIGTSSSAGGTNHFITNNSGISVTVGGQNIVKFNSSDGTIRFNTITNNSNEDSVLASTISTGIIHQICLSCRLDDTANVIRDQLSDTASALRSLISSSSSSSPAMQVITSATDSTTDLTSSSNIIVINYTLTGAEHEQFTLPSSPSENQEIKIYWIGNISTPSTDINITGSQTFIDELGAVSTSVTTSTFAGETFQMLDIKYDTSSDTWYLIDHHTTH